jgi:protein ImuA
MSKGGVAVWIGSSQKIFPPALKLFNVEPDQIIFIDTKNKRDLLWLVEETLKCEGLAAVVAEVPEVSFTASRRLQLAVEQSRVTGFLIRNNLRNINTNACTARWKISSNPSNITDEMPGIGFPVWNIELLKVRNGKPGTWQMQWTSNKLHCIPDPIILPSEEQRKTG